MRFVKFCLDYTVIVFCLVLIAGCRLTGGNRIEYRIGGDFEGAVVVRCDQSGESGVSKFQESKIIEIPSSGVTSVATGCAEISGRPRFVSNEQNGLELDYLFSRKELAGQGENSFESITEEERINKVYVMNYEEGNFNTANGVVRYFSFLVCKPKDGNYYASTDLINKITKLRQTKE